MKISDIKPELLGGVFGVFLLVIFSFLTRAYENLLNNPQFEKYAFNALETFNTSIFRITFYFVLAICINYFFRSVMNSPKRLFLGKGSMANSLGYTYKNHGLKKYLRRIFIQLFRPFITADKSNQLSLYLFINLSLILLFFNPNEYFKNISYSVIAAVIFQYFIVMLSQEKRKTLIAKKLMSSCRTIREREKVLYEVLGYDEPILLCLMTCAQQKEIKKKISSKLKNDNPIGILKSCHENRMEGYFGGFNQVVLDANWNFRQLLRFLYNQDLGSFDSIKNVGIEVFDQLPFALDDVNYQVYFFNGFEQKNSDNIALGYYRYLKARQDFLVTYHRSAMNNIHEHDEDYLLPLL